MKLDIEELEQSDWVTQYILARLVYDVTCTIDMGVRIAVNREKNVVFAPV